MKIIHQTFVGCLFFCCVTASLRGQDSDKTDSRLEAMMGLARQLKMRWPDAPERAAPQLMDAPVLRCNDPTRQEVDGAVWLWLDGKRPVAGMCLMYYASGKWNYEHTSLIDEALEVTGRPAWTWRPQAEQRVWVTLPEAVPEALRARQLALRAIPRRFEASEVRRGETFHLRLVDRPIYTYSDPEHGIVDGALFAISYGTNPEILVQVEARSKDGKLGWHVAFSRLSAAEVTVRLADKEIWKVDAANDKDPRAPYYADNR